MKNSRVRDWLPEDARTALRVVFASVHGHAQVPVIVPAEADDASRARSRLVKKET